MVSAAVLASHLVSTDILGPSFCFAAVIFTPVCLYLATSHRGIFVISVCFSFSGHCGAVKPSSEQSGYLDVCDKHMRVQPDHTNLFT